MSQRRPKRRRSRGRFPILYKVLSAALILAAVVGACVVFFRVEEVTISGNVNYSAEEIRAVSGVKQGENLFLISGYKVRRDLLKKLPYIDQVSVKRQLPDTLAISVVETKGVGMVQGPDGWWLLNSSGKLVERCATKPAGDRFTITGIEPLAPGEGTYLAVVTEQRSKLDSLLALMRAMEGEKLLEKTNSIDLSDGYQIIIRYDGRFTLKLPATEDFAYRMRFFREGLESGRVPETGNFTVDMSLEGQTRFIPAE
ncbi:MAG: FtsQ-type POTRA domain-containing protein [Oscillospiraceae bacterium]